VNAERQALEDLARSYGVQLGYRSLTGEWKVPGDEALVGVLRALGAPLASPAEAAEALRVRRRGQREQLVEPVLVAWNGRPARLPLRLTPRERGATVRLTAVLEDGGEFGREEVRPGGDDGGSGRRRIARLTLPWRWPLGRHRLVVDTAERRAEATVLSAPRRARLDGLRRPSWGFFLPLYAARSARDWGIGDVHELRELMDWCAEGGGAVVGTLPLLATFLDRPFEPSPYAPVSRAMWNEVYIDVETVSEVRSAPAAREVLAADSLRQELARLRAEPLVDYRRVMELKRRVLEPAAAAIARDEGPRRAAFDAFVREREELAAYARFRAVTERRGESWHVWPDHLREARFEAGDFDPEVEHYYLYGQWVIQQQLEAMADEATRARTGLYLDLPLGVHPDGYEAWAYREEFARGASTGAPPDDFFAGGQDWGFPPPHPEETRQSGHALLAASLDHHLRVARALRLDHVMSLHRLYWVPHGRPATEGAYVSYPHEELYALVCLASHRHEAAIIGEDLGTVPDEVRSGMARHNLLGMRGLQQKERENEPRHDEEIPRDTLAALNTHDMPTYAGFWHGTDVKAREALGHMSAEEAARELGARAEHRRAASRRLGAHEGEVDVRNALEDDLRRLARSDARLVLVNLEDALLETEPQNLPGTTSEQQPNWRRRARTTIAAAREDEAVQGILDAAAEGRRTRSGQRRKR
jgi:4-alpha-glucanotransferase